MLDEDLRLDDDEDEGGENWLASYSDLMTDLMAVFVILFSFAMMNQSYQTAKLKEELAEKNETSQTQVVSDTDDGSGSSGLSKGDEKFDKLYAILKAEIDKSGYTDSIIITKTDEFINFRFADNVLFLPNSTKIKDGSYNILKYIGDVLLGVNEYTNSIDITGHVADVGKKSDYDWQLSSDRALAVLNFLVKECKLPEDKMSIVGRAYHDQITDGSSKDSLSLNRRVELKITRKVD